MFADRNREHQVAADDVKREVAVKVVVAVEVTPFPVAMQSRLRCAIFCRPADAPRTASPARGLAGLSLQNTRRVSGCRTAKLGASRAVA